MDTDPLAATAAATRQTLAGVLGAQMVPGHPAPGLLGGEAQTAPVPLGRAGLPALGAPMHLGLLGRVARLRLPRPALSPPLSRVHLPRRWRMAFKSRLLLRVRLLVDRERRLRLLHPRVLHLVWVSLALV